MIKYPTMNRRMVKQKNVKQKKVEYNAPLSKSRDHFHFRFQEIRNLLSLFTESTFVDSLQTTFTFDGSVITTFFDTKNVEKW